MLPDEYPLIDEVDSILVDELGFGRLLDYGVILPRLQQVFAWSAAELGTPALMSCIRDGSMIYAWPYSRRAVWHVPPSRPVRFVRRVLPPQPLAADQV